MPGSVAPWATGLTWQAWGVILGIGVDLVDIARMDEALRRTPALAFRLFTEGERNRASASLAACFAANCGSIESRANVKRFDSISSLF